MGEQSGERGCFLLCTFDSSVAYHASRDSSTEFVRLFFFFLFLFKDVTEAFGMNAGNEY